MILAEGGLALGIGAVVTAIIAAVLAIFFRGGQGKARKQKADVLREENVADEASLQEQIEDDIQRREKDRRARASYDVVRSDLRVKLKRAPSTVEIVQELRRRRET